MTPRKASATAWQVAALAAMLAVGWFLWQPGLTGGFVFDDFPNLSGLEQISAEPSLYEALKYVAGGISSQIGRPLSLVTFAVQHESWPDDPGAFARGNISLHLLNAALLFWWLHRWSRLADARFSGGRLVPFAVTALWLLTPLHVATVLYVVQRMTLLAGTCVLAGMLLHTVGREVAARGRVRTGYWLMTAGLGAGLVLGTLAKESAALFPLLVLIYEATLLRHLPRPPRWRVWSTIMLVLPVAVLAAYLARSVPGFVAGYELRDFSMAERLLTEARVLFLYVWKLFVPSPYGMRLLYDDLPVSRSWLDPWTTIPAVVAWLGVAIAAIGWRARWPVFSFAVLWYLAAHVLESSFIPLEIAFEHRNYHAVIGPLLAVALMAATLAQMPSVRRIRLVLPLGGALYGVLVAACLWQATNFWGDRNLRTYHWATRQPESVRAMHDFASLLFEHGRIAEAQKVYALAMQRWPDDATLPFKLMLYGCVFADVSVPASAELAQAIGRMPAPTPTFIGSLDQLVGVIEGGTCSRHSVAELRAVYAAALRAPRLQHSRQNLCLMNSRLAELDGDHAAARQLLDEAIRLGPNLTLLTQGVQWALGEDDLAAAKQYLEILPRLSRVNRWTHRLEISGLRQLVSLYEEVMRAQALDRGAPLPR